MATSMPPTSRSGGGMSGLTEDEARSFHGMFITSFIAFTVIAIVAHWMVWSWRPWIPGTEGYPAPSVSAPSVPR